ncbi:MAG: J domain-containing protein [Verrucomicrobiales bacterium]|nr:J domain-containing protein [Verrucomicrobiales bacterium]
MPVEFKDYYATLGVPRDASDDAIKQAFRKLARKYHPDVAPDKRDAEEQFKAINEAYEVLGDPAKRKKYDTLGANWKRGAGFEPPPGWERARGARSSGGTAEEFHFGGTGFSDFFEQFFGGGARFSGIEDLFGRAAAGPDAGRGFGRAATARKGTDVEGDILVTLDEVLHGSIREISLRRQDPRTGQSETHSFKVRIPSGVQEGQNIRVSGKGGEGLGGGAPGDLYLRVRLAAHPDFRVRGADLFHEMDLAPWEAVLGTTISVPTLDRPVSVRIPPGTVNGQQLRVRGRGLPSGGGPPGDLYVVLQVQVPRTVSDEERRLWQDLRDASRFNPRAT